MQSGGVPSGTRCTVAQRAHTHVYYSDCYLNGCVQTYRSRRLSCTLQRAWFILKSLNPSLDALQTVVEHFFHTPEWLPPVLRSHDVPGLVQAPRAVLRARVCRAGARARARAVCAPHQGGRGGQGLGGGGKGGMSLSPPGQRGPMAGQPTWAAARVLACRLAGEGRAAGSSSPAGWQALDPAAHVPCRGLGSPCPVPWKATSLALAPRVDSHDCRERVSPGQSRLHLLWGDCGAESQPHPTRGTASDGQSCPLPSSAGGTTTRGLRFLPYVAVALEGPFLQRPGWVLASPLRAGRGLTCPSSLTAASLGGRVRPPGASPAVPALCQPPASCPLPPSSGVI